MRFTTFGDSDAAGLKSPGVVTAGRGGSEPTVGVNKDGWLPAVSAVAN